MIFVLIYLRIQNNLLISLGIHIRKCTTMQQMLDQLEPLLISTRTTRNIDAVVNRYIFVWQQ